MAEDLIVGGAGEILKRLISLGFNEIGLMLGVNAEVRKLRSVLINIQQVIQDAEEKQVKERRLRGWLKELKEVAYDAEDVLDEIAYKELKYTIISKASKWVSFPKRLVVHNKIARKIKAINQELDDIDMRRNMLFQLESNQSGSSSFGQMFTDERERERERETASHVKDSTVIGREKDKEKIIEMLINDGSSSSADHQESTGNNAGLSVISIVGLGGIGKTTLAQLVYNDRAVEKHFELKAWVCVSTHFRTANLFFQILDQINPNNTKPESSSKQVLQNELQRQLGGEKKFLLVLDDDWNEDETKWEDFVFPLRDFVATGSRIIVTSRDSNVASVKRAQVVHQLEGLSEDSCWGLIKSQAFKQGEPEKTSWAEIGKQISNKCKGVPLAAKVLGGLLQSKKEEREWLVVLNAEIWSSDEGNQIMNVLKLSYDNLSPALQACFSYCAIFPKDFWIEKVELIHLWMAQGLLEASSSQCVLSLEDVGAKCFDTLYSKSFFHEAVMDEYGEVTRCKMHDLVHDLAQCISGSECQVLGKRNLMRIDLSNCRHVSMISLSTTKAWHEGEKVRTIYGWESNYIEFYNGGPLDEVTKISIFSKFKLLRVLDLSGFRGSDLPPSLGKLIHLRYLDLSNTGIGSLPEWVTRLYHMQTLVLLKCRNLTALPEDLMNLKKLRHLLIDDFRKWKKLPQAIGELDQLQTLPFFVAHEEDGISVLKNLNNLRGTFNICRLRLVKEESLPKIVKILSDKCNLRELKLHWNRETSLEVEVDDLDNDLLVLEELQPHINLQWLSINGFGGVEFPAWLSSGSDLPCLVGMDLSFCNRCEHIPSFGGLPRLKWLVIGFTNQVKHFGGGSKDGPACTTSSTQSSYGSLKKLVLRWMTNLEEWSEKDAVTSFPCLEELLIENCSNLSKTPHSFPSLKSLDLENVSVAGVVSLTTSLTSLTSLQITRCHGLEFLPDGLLRNNKQLKVMEVSYCLKLHAFLANDDDQDCGDLTSISDAVVLFPCLEELLIKNCPNLRKAPHLFPSLKSLALENVGGMGVVSMTSSLTSLTSLKITKCKDLEFLREGLVSNNNQLNVVVIGDCPKLLAFREEGLANEIFSNSFLRRLEISHISLGSGREEILSIENCPKLESIGKGFLSSLVFLESFQVRGCSKLKNIELSQSFNHLRTLQIWSCPNFEGFSHHNLTTEQEQLFLLPCCYTLQILYCPAISSIDLRSFPSLRELTIQGCPAMTSIDLPSFPSLRDLSIEHCKGLQALQGLQFLTALEKLRVGGFSPALNYFPLTITDDDDDDAALESNNPLLPSLRELDIYGWPALQSLPHHLQRLTTLKSLEIWNFTNLTKLPEWLGNLTSLEKLVIYCCENLLQLPSKEQMLRLTFLKELRGYGCPQLKERCSRDGEEWSKISHIPHAFIRY